MNQRQDTSSQGSASLRSPPAVNASAIQEMSPSSQIRLLLQRRYAPILPPNIQQPSMELQSRHPLTSIAPPALCMAAARHQNPYLGLPAIREAAQPTLQASLLNQIRVESLLATLLAAPSSSPQRISNVQPALTHNDLSVLGQPALTNYDLSVLSSRILSQGNVNPLQETRTSTSIAPPSSNPVATNPTIPNIPEKGVASMDDPQQCEGLQEHGVEVISSERSKLKISHEVKSPLEAIQTLALIGETRRSKSDPFIDASKIPDPVQAPGYRATQFFPGKLYKLLTDMNKDDKSSIISWLPHGRAFILKKHEEFEKNVLPHYFQGTTKRRSFLRQLQLYGFLRVSKGPDSGAYYHELFIRTKPNLCRYIQRVGIPHGLDRRTFKLPDGDDPDFYAMQYMPESAEE